jgi:hypothetical protein
MKFAVTNQALALLENALESAVQAARVRGQVEMAWHLRQRDSLRAMALVAEAERRLRNHPLVAELCRGLRARLSLAACHTCAA